MTETLTTFARDHEGSWNDGRTLEPTPELVWNLEPDAESVTPVCWRPVIYRREHVAGELPRWTPVEVLFTDLGGGFDQPEYRMEWVLLPEAVKRGRASGLPRVRQARDGGIAIAFGDLLDEAERVEAALTGNLFCRVSRRGRLLPFELDLMRAEETGGSQNVRLLLALTNPEDVYWVIRWSGLQLHMDPSDAPLLPEDVRRAVEFAKWHFPRCG